MDEETIKAKLRLLHDNSLTAKIRKLSGRQKITTDDIHYLRTVLKKEIPLTSVKDFELSEENLKIFQENGGIDGLPGEYIIHVYEQHEKAKAWAKADPENRESHNVAERIFQKMISDMEKSARPLKKN